MKKSCLLVCLFLFCLSAGRFNESHAVTVSTEAVSSTESVSPAVADTDILLLSCIDFRLVDSVGRYMAKEGLTNKYDHVILAGASLGADNKKFPAWRKTFWEHLQVAITLHRIHTVMIMDHKDCGAYRVILGEHAVGTPELEMKAHTAQLRSLARQIKAQHPKLKVELLLMSLDGSVEKIPNANAVK
jgi:hypothetical protein